MEHHTIGPVYDKDSRILILGSFPSVKSRETRFFYGHPMNRFWRVIAAVTGEETPVSVEDKKDLLIRRRIALWDVIKSCEITGSSDNSIRSVTPNDLSLIFESADIEKIFTNGRTAYKLFTKYNPNRDAVCLPSTSPANASLGLEGLIEKWSVIKDFT